MSAQTKRLGWRIGLGVAVVGVVSVGAFGIAAAAANEQESAAPAPTEEHDGPPWAGHDGDGGWGGGDWNGFGLFQTLEDLNVEDLSHAEVVLATEGGGSTTMLVQKGTVTAVDGDSIAVRSADGFATTYTVNAETTVNGDAKIDSVAKDEQVVVIAPKQGQTPTADTVLDLNDLGWK
ncbi:hypothetical protein [Actinophytocola sediminis]